jgi:DNA polymerase-3 subunit alpha
MGVLKRYTVFDIETTGVPDRDSKYEEDYMEFPHIVSIAWRSKNNASKHFIINQEGRKIDPKLTAIHGISTKMANQSPHTYASVFPMLIDDCSKSAHIVGHNLFFDTSILKANIFRSFGKDSKMAKDAVEALDKDKRIDTMWSAIRAKITTGKWPSLTELHAKLFNGRGFKAHDALEDILACERCFLEMVKRKAISI